MRAPWSRQPARARGHLPAARPGIKRKLMLVLIGVLLLSSSLDAALASYFTNRQNQELAFVALDRSLRAWHDDLQATTGRLKGAALSTVGDTVVLNQLNELISRESPASVGDVGIQGDGAALARGLSYARAVSLNRLNLALRTSGFSRIAVYTGGQLSHAVSASGAGMMIRRGDSAPLWVSAPADASGKLDFQSWPAWQAGPLPAGTPMTLADARQPVVSITFPSPSAAAINVIVPVQGMFEEFLTELLPLKFRLVSGISIAGAAPQAASKGKPKIVASVVFSRLIDRAALAAVAAQTGMAPELISPDGGQRQRLDGAAALPEPLLRQALQLAPGQAPRTVLASQESSYAALLPWQYEGQTRMVLGLSASRASTLSNVRQTVSAILLASGLILVLSIAVGTYWVGHFIDPIVALTDAVKQIGSKRRLAGRPPDGGASGPARLDHVPVAGPDEIGELSAAFNVMTDELQRAFETLEQRVQARTAELRQQTRYLRTLIDTLPMQVWLKDTELRYLAVNQANADACGHPVEDIVGKTDRQLWPAGLAERFMADDAAALSARARTTVEQAVPGAGAQAWMETYRAPVLDEDGTLLGMVGVARDISAFKAAEAAREAALAEAVRLARQRSDFLAQMSHELRTPLNAIMGYAQLLRRDTHQLTERQANGLATIHESGQHLLTLINDILDLARVEAGKMVLFPTPTHLGGFLRVVTDIMRVKAEEKSLLFSFDAAPDLPCAVALDEKRLRQVLLNLLGNAVKFTDRGEVALRVRLAPGQALPGRARLHFEVADSGIGMSAEQLARIFQPFEQVADMQRREGGTGLGLAISQQLIHLMGARIEVESEPGKGSRFWFELDLPVANEIVANPPVAQAKAGYEGKRKRVLVVDDVPKNRAMLMDMLQTLGFRVADARNGQECLDALDSFQPDLIIMDLMMPVMDGHEATRRIRQMPAWAAVPVITVTASASRDDELNSYAAGANAFLPKPVDHGQLLAAIGDLLALRWISDAAPLDGLEGGADAAAELVLPSPLEMEALAQLARLGNMQKIHERADYLQALDPALTPFAERLHALALGYRSKALAAFIARYLPGHRDPAARPAAPDADAPQGDGKPE